VAEWRSSGLTSVAFSEGKPFSAGGLRHWAHRLKAGRRRKALRVVRVERRPSVARATRPVADATDGSLVIELGAARVVVRPGFDRAMLAAVLEVALAASTGRAA